MKGGNRKNGSRRVQNVRVLDDYAGDDGAKFDRVLSQLQNSHSQVTLCCSDEFLIGVSTTAQNSILGQSQIRVFDDFVSLSAQFQTFRVKRIRFDVYDVNPGVSAGAVWSTWHDVTSTSSQYVPTFQQTVDAPDSQIVPPGTGKATFVWTAKGTAENEFQSTANNSGVTQLDFGGLRYWIPGQAATGSKYAVVVKAIVDFRGRT
jgi:hypothetical protein